MSKQSPIFLRLFSLNKALQPSSGLDKIDKKVVFILSTGRTGTKFLASYYSKAPGVFAVHEPKPSRVLRLWTMAYFQSKVSETKMAQVLNKFRLKLIQNVREETYIESNNFMAGFAPSITKEFKEPIIIHVVRDPRDYIKSAMNKRANSGLKGLVNRLMPYAHLPLGEGENAVLIRTATYWEMTNRCLQQAGKDYKNYHLFKFEDIVDPGSDALDKLSNILNVAMDKKPLGKNKKINQAHLSVMSGWQTWSAEQCEIVQDICGPLMREYGYGNEPEWKSRFKRT